MRKKLITVAVAAALGMGGALSVASDEIVLKDGSRIVGKVVKSAAGEIKVETAFAGTLTIQSDQISQMNTDDSLVVKLKDGRVTQQQPITLNAGKVEASSEEGQAISYELADIKYINPEPWELGLGYRWQGLANVALKLERGNTEKDQFSVLINNSWRSLRDRYTLQFTANNDKTKDVRTADNWSLTGKYDYFMADPRHYWGVNASLQSDKFTDLDLRTYVGPYYGVQWFDDPVFTLSTETGIVYTKEEFSTSPDKEYPGANWTVDITSNYFGGGSRLYLNHVGVMSLEDVSDLLLTTRAGIAFPLLGKLEAGAEVLLKYDAGVTGDVEKLDETYSLRVGYSW